MANNLGDLQDSGTLVQNTNAIVNGATTNSTSVIIATANPYIFVGQTVTGSGIQNANGITGATKVTAISADGLTLTLSNPATLVDKVTLVFLSVYAPTATTTVNGAISSATNSVTIVANTLIAVGQLVSGVGINAATATTANTVNNNATSTTLVLNAATSAAVADKAVLVFWNLANANIGTDFVWGNYAIQPNDDRATTPAGNFVASGVTTAKITDASSTGKITTFTTDVAHGISAGQYVNTGIYAIGGTVAVPTAGTTVSATTGTSTSVTLAAATPTADTTQGTVTLATSAAHNISVGELVTISGGLTTAAVYNGTFTALTGTTGSTLVVANATAAVASPAATTTACTLAVNHFDVKEALVLSATTTSPYTFTIAQALSNINAVAPTGKTASLEVVYDSSWSATTKAQSSRLAVSKLTDSASKDRFVISNTVNGNSLETPIDGALLVDSGFYGFPNFNTGKYSASAATVGGSTGNSYIVVTCPNNFAETLTLGTSTVNVTGFNNTALTTALTGATVVSATSDYFVVAGTNALLGTTVTGTALVQVVGWGIANYNVTAVTVDGTTNTTYIYTAQNNLQKGDKVTITGLVSNATLNPNISNVTVASATATSFTVTGQTASTVSYGFTGQVGKAEYTNALANVDGAFATGTFGYLVPSVIGKYDALANDALKDRGFVQSAGSTTSSSSNAVGVSSVARTAGSTLAVLTNSTSTDFTNIVVGDVLTVSSSSLAGLVNALDYQVVAKIDAKNVVVNSGSNAVLSSGTLTLTPRVGTVHAQQYAAGTARTTTAITTGLWA